jgi:hypothetical protein
VAWFDGITFQRTRTADDLSANLNTSNAYGSCFGGGSSCTATSNTITVTAAGGSPTYTYLWEKVSGDTLTVSNSTSASTTFSKFGAVIYTAVYRCKVTDSEGTIAYSANVYITLECDNGL